MPRSVETALYSASVNTKTTRILFVDAMRGLCLVLMTLDHLPENPFSRFNNFVFGAFGFFTAASGFVFLSGWITGRVYGRYRASCGAESLNRRILIRLSKLYASQLILIAVIGVPTAFHFLNASRLRLDLFSSHPLRAFVLAATFIYDIGYLGILPMYFIFLVATPWLLGLLQKGYERRVFAASAAIWLLPLIFTRIRLQQDLKFNPLSYQILFVGGIILGDQSLSHIVPKMRRALIVICAILSVLFFSLRLSYSVFKPVRHVVNGPMYPLFSLGEMGPVRLLSFAAFAVTLWFIWQTLYPIGQKNRFFDWLAMLGQNSLVVFVWSVSLTAMITILGVHSPLRSRRIEIVLLAIGSLSIPALLGSMARNKMRRGFKNFGDQIPATATNS